MPAFNLLNKIPIIPIKPIGSVIVIEQKKTGTKERVKTQKAKKKREIS